MRDASARIRIAAVIGVAVAVATTYAMTRGGRAPAAVIAAQPAGAPRPAGAKIEVTYIANEGVLIAGDGKQVLIDGLHREYQADYPFLPQPYRDQIETAQAPFDRIDLILVSHRHLDHFHPESVARYLRSNAATTLLSSEQVVDEVETNAADFAAIRARVKRLTPALRQTVVGSAGGVPVEVLGLGHGSGRHATIQNLGHLVTLAGKRLLHLGDADTDATIFAPLNLDEKAIDVAFVPMWFLTSDEGAAIVREHIKPRHIVAVHMPARDPEHAVSQIRERFPDAVTFTALLDKRYY